MARSFDIPEFYRSPIISVIKQARRLEDQRKKDRSPSLLRVGDLTFKIARHFGFCFGVENAIEIAYRAVAENPDKRVFLLSEMIHNPQVNNDLRERGVEFLLATDGSELVPFDNLQPEDIVIVPAFGTTVELFDQLAKIGVDPYRYNTTCPFVEKVWKRAHQLGEQGYSVIVHGKETHEETRATFSHARVTAPTLVIRDRAEAEKLAAYIRRDLSVEKFEEIFAGRYSQNFDPESSLERIGVVNQTTMLASETQDISDILRRAIESRYGTSQQSKHFANTRDTLCYATYENQEAVRGMIETGGDLAIVVGGYNSSNTSHLVELCLSRMPTYHIKDAGEILGKDCIRHLDFQTGEIQESSDWLNVTRPLEILITAGASCPDALVDRVLKRIIDIYGVSEEIETALAPFREIASAAETGAGLPVL